MSPAPCPRPEELEDAEQDEHPGTHRAHRPGRRHRLDPAHQRDDQRDRCRVPERDGHERLHDGFAPALLKTTRHREEPAHPGVHPVVGAQHRERQPGREAAHG